MGMSLEQFAAECRRILESTPGPAGRKKVGAVVQEMLKDDAFVAKHVGDDVPERKILYEDPDARLLHPRAQLLGREGEPAARSRPVVGDLRPGARRDDHERLDGARAGDRSQGRQGQARAQLSAQAGLTPTSTTRATSTRRGGTGPTKLIRIEGTNMSKVKRLSFEKA